MSNQDILFKVAAPVASVTFNRPDVRNSMRFGMYDELENICRRVADDERIRVLTLRGAGGRAFVAGTDIGEFGGFRSDDDAIAYERRIEQVVGALECLECVTIAILEGACAGGGVAMALACDFRFSNRALKFGVPVARTLGNCLAVSNVARLIDHLGVAKTREMLMLAKFLDADACRRLGVVNDSFEDDVLDAKVGEVIDRILSLAPLTLRASKIAIRRTLEARRAASGASEDLIRSCYSSTDFHEATAAFLRKERHQWRGR